MTILRTSWRFQPPLSPHHPPNQNAPTWHIVHLCYGLVPCTGAWNDTKKVFFGAGGDVRPSKLARRDLSGEQVKEIASAREARLHPAPASLNCCLRIYRNRHA
jgi:hypothetical protein